MVLTYALSPIPNSITLSTVDRMSTFTLVIVYLYLVAVETRTGKENPGGVVVACTVEQETHYDNSP